MNTMMIHEEIKSLVCASHDQRKLKLFINPIQRLSNDFYRLGSLYSSRNDVAKSLDCYSDSFLLRNLDLQEIDPDFVEFFKIQFAIYLLGRKVLKVALCEGDMVFSLIQDEWVLLMKEIEDSPFTFNKDSLREWYKTIEIDFPWYLEDMDVLL